MIIKFSKSVTLSRILPFLLLMPVLLLGACENEVPNRTSTVVLNPSSPPCWYQICPGTTTKDEAMSILSTIPEIKQNSILDRYHENAQSFVSWLFIPEVAEGEARFYYWGNTISHFNFYTQSTLSFAEAIDIFGEPTYVLPFSGCADSRWLYIALIYPDDGVYLVYFQSPWRRGEAAELNPQQAVRGLLFYDPARFEYLITHVEGANWNFYSYDDILSILQPWEGFGEMWVFETC